MKKSKRINGYEKLRIRISELEEQNNVPLIDKLSKAIEMARLGEVDVGSFGDGSGSWIELTLGKRSLVISFDDSGNKLTGIGLWRSIVKVVDYKKIFEFEKK